MAELSPRSSIPCFYNLKPAHQEQVDQITPHSTGQAPIDAEKQTFVVSPAETHSYYPDEKTTAVSRVPTLNRGDQLHLDLEVTVKQNNPVYKPESLPERPPKKPFWKRHLLWLLTILALIAIFIGVLVGITWHHGTATQTSMTIPNNTLHSVASSGLFLSDNTTWNMQVFWQNKTGGINLQVSLDGKTFQPSRAVALDIEPKVGSPMSATAEIDPATGVVMLNLFYISGTNNISMSAVTCPANSANCNTINNCYLPTTNSPNEYTGLAAVNVKDAENWRVYYYDEAGYLSELAGNSSGFDIGMPIGGLALNSSSIAAVNINSTTKNINVFYVDQLTQALFTTEFQGEGGEWTTPSPVSFERVTSWNPTSGLGAAYSVGQDQLHVYYTGLDLGVYEFLGGYASLKNKTWLAQPGRNHIWAEADYVGADITAVGWLDQVRFFQVAQNKMVQGSLNSTLWTESFVSPVQL